MKKHIRYFLLLFVFLLPFVISANGISENAVRLSSLSSSIFENCCDTVICDFSETPELWQGVNDEYLTVKETLPAFPYTPLTGDGCLTVRATGSDGKITRSFNKLDLSEYEVLCIPVNCQSSSQDIVFEITVYSGYRKYSALCSVVSEEWNIVKIDISEFEYKNGITEINLSLSANDNEAISEFYIDGLFGCVSDSEFNKKVNFIFSDYQPYNSTADFSETSLSLTSTGEVCGFITDSDTSEVFEKATGILINFSSESAVDTVCLCSANKDGTYILRSKQTPVLSEGGYSVVFPVSDIENYGFKIDFSSKEEQVINISGISPVLNYFEPEALGKIESCTVNGSENEVVVRGKLTAEATEKYKNGSIALISLNIGENENTLDLSKVTFEDKTDISGKDFSLKSTYNENEEKTNITCKKYCCIIFNNNGWELLGSPCYITNSEVFGTNKTSYSHSDNKKGLYNVEAWQIKEYSIKETAVWFDIGKFFSRTSDTGSKFSFGDSFYYYNSSYAENIDRQIRELTEENVNITLILVLSDTGSDALNEILIHPKSDISMGYCAFNTESIAGANYIQAVCDYLASKYCSEDNTEGRIQNISVGYNVNSAFSEYNMGNSNGIEFAESYAKALRIVNNTFKTYCPSLKIFTSVDGHFDEGLSYDICSRYDSKTFISLLCKIIRNSGNIELNFLVDPVSFGTTDNNKKIGFENIEILFSHIKSVCNSDDFTLAVVESSKSLTNEKAVSQYIFGMYKTLNSDVAFYIADLCFENNEVLKYIDTDKTLSSTYFAPQVLGINDWSSAIPNFDVDNAIFRYISFKSFSTPAKEFSGEWTVFDFTDSENGFSGFGKDEIIKSGFSLSGISHTLYIKTSSLSNGKIGGIINYFSTPLDLSDIPYIYISVNPSSLSEGISSLPVRITFTSGKNKLMFTGNAKKAEWTEFCCDLSDVEWADKIDSFSVTAVSEEGVDLGSPQICISSVVGKSTEYSNEELNEIYGNTTDFISVIFSKQALPVYIIIIILSAILLFRRIYKRKIKR